MREPLQVAIIGMGGFAGAHHDAILRLEKEGICRLIATCDPQRALFAERETQLEFRARGVRMFDDHRAMLDAEREALDMVTIPTPITLHAPMHRAAVERGIPVYLEKPPTLDWAELEEMIALDERAERKTQVAFNYIVERERQALKQRILSGEFGRIRKACFSGLSPRSTRYYARTDWSARLLTGDRLVLDSPMGNAMAHQVHDTLFWAGQRGLFHWAEILKVEAELYRAHDIEGMDTALLRATTAGGVELQVALSHACDGAHRQREWVECEKAVLTYEPGTRFAVDWTDGRKEREQWPPRDLLAENLRVYMEYVLGRQPRPMTRLEDARPFVALNDLAYLASGRITRVPAQFLRRSTMEDGGVLVAIEDLDGIVERFFRTGEFAREQGVAWAAPHGAAGGKDLKSLRAAVERMAVEARGVATA